MVYKTAKDLRAAAHKNIVLFGMSGLGKTHLSNLLRAEGEWFHYSIDYRIGTRYMGEHIADSFKREAMKVSYLRDLLLSDSIYIGSNITFENLAPLSTYLGKPGARAMGGLSFDEYMRRQDLHSAAEISALLDTVNFIDRAQSIYGYRNFVCDSGGSICEVVSPDDPADPVLTALTSCCLLVWIEGSEAHTEALIERFDRSPKPMCYQPQFLRACWDQYLYKNKKLPEDVHPDEFVRWVYAQALAHRQPRYQAMAKWGVTVTADEVARVNDTASFETLIAQALERQK
ncbi:MAG: ATPase [Paracoccaceae bacterium]|nr:ATPase [Paracoccaceae bacterium]